MVYLPTSTTCFAICWALFLSVCACHSAISIFSITFVSFTLSICVFPFWPCLHLSLLIASKSFVSHFSNTAFCDLCASTLWAQAETCSLFTSLGSFSTINTFIISVVMTSLFMPLMNCPFTLQLFSLYLHSAAFTHNLPIHSCTDFSLFLLHLHY